MRNQYEEGDNVFASGYVRNYLEFEVSLVQLEIFNRLNSINLKRRDQKWRCKSGAFGI